MLLLLLLLRVKAVKKIDRLEFISLSIDRVVVLMSNILVY